jgi:hypothetical protein
MIIGLIGQKRVGKDTVATIIQELEPSFTRYALADPIKDIARIMFGFSESQLFDNEKDILDAHWNIKPREFFEKFGTDIMQFDIYNYLPALENSVPKRCFWVHSLLKKIDHEHNTQNDARNVIITDVRGTHELEAIKNHYPKAIFIKVTRQQNFSQKSSDNAHISQLEPEMISTNQINYTITNDETIDKLKVKIKNILEVINS